MLTVRALPVHDICGNVLSPREGRARGGLRCLVFRSRFDCVNFDSGGVRAWATNAASCVIPNEFGRAYAGGLVTDRTDRALRGDPQGLQAGGFPPYLRLSHPKVDSLF